MELFNVSEYRRKTCSGFKNSEWFKNSNSEALDLRKQYNEMAIADMIIFLNAHSNGVAIFDATNSSHKVRAGFVAMIQPTGR